VYLRGSAESERLPRLTNWVDLVQVTTLAGSAAIIGSGLHLGARLRKVGGLELALAHVVANRVRRKVFLGAVSVTISAFLAFGVVAGIAGSGLLRDDVEDLLQALVFLVGACGFLLLVANGLRPSALSLQEE